MNVKTVPNSRTGSRGSMFPMLIRLSISLSIVFVLVVNFQAAIKSRDLVSTMVSTVCFNFLLFGSKLGHSRILDSLWSALRRCSGVRI